MIIVSSISNHLDYEKWNKHQHYESMEDVFTVIGKAYRLPTLITEIQCIFEKPWMYYTDRCYLIAADGKTIYNNSNDLVY